jgi:hypothetical protein
LKEKIIMLSLGLGNNCTGLLKEITNLIAEGGNRVNDFDIIDVLDDLNQLQSSQTNNEFGRVISFLRDAEQNENKLANIAYPYSIPFFHDCVLLQFDDWLAYHPARGLKEELLMISKYNQRWFEYQPASLPCLLKDYHIRWQRDMKSASQSALTTSFMYSIQILLKGEDAINEGGSLLVALFFKISIVNRCLCCNRRKNRN